MLPFEGPSSRTMSTPVALFLYAMPGLAIMSLVACGSMKSPTAKAGASLLVTKKKEKTIWWEGQDISEWIFNGHE